MEAPAAESKEQLIPMGTFGRPHGVRGELRLWLHNQDCELLQKGRVLQVAPELREGKPDPSKLRSLRIESAKRDAKGWIVQFEEIQDRDRAMELSGFSWFESRQNFSPLKSDEIYLVDLIGCEVCTASLGKIGRVTDLCEAAGKPYLVVQVGSEERLVPACREFLLDFDQEAQLLTVIDLEGLLRE